MNFNIIKTNYRIIKPYIYILIFITMFVIKAIININNIDYLTFGMTKININVLFAIATAIQNLSLIYLVVELKQRGYYISILLLTINIAILCIPIKQGSFYAFVGVTNTLVELCMLIVLNKYLDKIKKHKADLYKMASTDSLTGLPNRRSLIDYLKDKVNHNTKFGLVFIDLDNFKNINDTLGHDYGDKVLCEVTDRWNNLLNEDDFLARLGGDEFALVINDYKSKEELFDNVSLYLNSLFDTFHLKNEDFFISASMGISCYPEHSDKYEILLRYADTAMYDAKREGKKQISIFEKKQMDIIKEDLQMENKIRNAIKNKNFFLNFQPQFQIQNHKLRGFETLVRMVDDDGNIVSPAIFIPQAEKTNLIIDIDKWVLNNALKGFKKFLEYNKNLIVSVNISVKHLQDNNLIDDVKKALEENDFPAENLEIEITESLFITSLSRSAKLLNELKALGVHIALDDFGTGYASLSYLNKLPIDILKVDKSFIDQLRKNGENNAFVEAIVSMGHTLKFKVISEGVEKEEQLDILNGFKCDYVQGFVWGKPMDYILAEQLVNSEYIQK